MEVYLSKAGMLLAPDSFHLAIEGEKFFGESKSSECSNEMLGKRVKRYENAMTKIDGHLKIADGIDEKERFVI